MSKILCIYGNPLYNIPRRLCIYIDGVAKSPETDYSKVLPELSPEEKERMQMFREEWNIKKKEIQKENFELLDGFIHNPKNRTDKIVADYILKGELPLSGVIETDEENLKREAERKREITGDIPK